MDNNSIKINLSEGINIIYVGIDVAKDKHDCFIINFEGEALTDVFTISNSKDCFDKLLQTIKNCTDIRDSKNKDRA